MIDMKYLLLLPLLLIGCESSFRVDHEAICVKHEIVYRCSFGDAGDGFKTLDECKTFKECKDKCNEYKKEREEAEARVKMAKT